MQWLLLLLFLRYLRVAIFVSLPKPKKAPQQEIAIS
jgi:hypothetical protein